MKERISIFEYNTISFALIKSTYIGICLSNIFFLARQDSWLSLLMAIVIGIVPICMFNYIIKNKPRLNIYEIINNCFGKNFGIIINVFLCLAVLGYGAIILSNLSSFISTLYLHNTPNTLITIIFLIPIFYILSKDIYTLGKTSIITFYISIFMFIISVSGLLNELDFNNIKPTLEYGFLPILKGSFQYICYNTLSLFILTIIPYDNIKKESNPLFKNFLAYILTSLCLLAIIFIILSVYGINSAIIENHPEFHVLKRITFANFIERLESVLSLQWVFDMFIAISLCLFYVKENIKELFNIKKKHFLMPLIITLVVGILSLILSNYNVYNNNLYLTTIPLIIAILFLFIPFIIFLIILIKNWKATKQLKKSQ